MLGKGFSRRLNEKKNTFFLVSHRPRRIYPKRTRQAVTRGDFGNILSKHHRETPNEHKQDQRISVWGKRVRGNDSERKLAFQNAN